MSSSEQFPNIAGQKESYLVTQLKKYKSGDRADVTMAAIVGPLNDQNIEDLAAYFSANSAVASYDFAAETLLIPYLEVGDSLFQVELKLSSPEPLTFTVSGVWLN
jgi:cytochrome c553